MTRVEFVRRVREGCMIANNRFEGSMLYPIAHLQRTAQPYRHTFSVFIRRHANEIWAMFRSDSFGLSKPVQITGMQLLHFVRRTFPRRLTKPECSL